jgi:tetratricopeptide (TPR) repeat protein
MERYSEAKQLYETLEIDEDVETNIAACGVFVDGSTPVTTPESRYNLSLSHAVRGRYEQALQLLGDGDWDDALRGYIFQRRGQLSDALKYYNNLKYNPINRRSEDVVIRALVQHNMSLLNRKKPTIIKDEEILSKLSSDQRALLDYNCGLVERDTELGEYRWIGEELKQKPKSILVT